ncbi:MAG: mechanosensitive ion channel family protein [Actinobacteria bacterium]|nr:mechanosensitive ion channel family protein [Actinomycetota bacterium]
MADPATLLEACGSSPGNACHFALEQTDSVGMAKAADWLTGTPLDILFVVLGAVVLNFLVRRVIKRFAARIEGSEQGGRLRRIREKTPSVFLDTGGVNMRAAARAQTIGIVLRSLASGLIWTFAFIYVLDALGLDLGPLLAGAGVAGVALGFGAQSLVRDFLSGTFMLIEDQYGVGDVVDVGEATGTVEQVTLRTTRLRDVNGTVWHVPNGQILRVGNKSQQWARAVVDVQVDPKADLEKAADVILSAAEEVWARDDARGDVLDQPEVLGIEYLGPDAATIRVQGKTRPGAQWRVSRLLRVQVSAALRKAEVPIPPANFTRPFTR